MHFQSAKSTNERAYQSGKRTVAPDGSDVANFSEHAHSLMYAHDRNSKLNFLVDTGASISVVPASKFGRKKRSPDGGMLAAANGSKSQLMVKEFFPLILVWEENILSYL